MAQVSISEFADRLSNMMPVISREFFKHQSSDYFKARLTMPQFAILNLLCKEGEMNMTDLAHYLNVSTAAMTGIVGRLVRDGYVVRVSEPDDRRIVKIKCTSKGSDIAHKMMEQHKKVTMEIFGKISQAEREQYLNILEHIMEHLKK